jgi:hypothetical protein
MAFQAKLAALVLFAFGAFSIWVVGTQGYLGFVTLAGREPWALQMLLDLVVSCALGIGWMVADARRRNLVVWPFVVATVLLGSLGLLAYVVRRR